MTTDPRRPVRPAVACTAGADPDATLNRLLRRLLTANSVSAVAQAAVDAARETLEVDLSWCGMVTGEYLTMAAYSGVRTTEMMGAWRLAVGAGVGGRVASEGKTLAVRDYRHDRRRVPEMKSVIDDEGIHCALCAPLANGPEVVGVVYAAQRDSRDWTDREIRVLTDIGRYCGVVLSRVQDQWHNRQLAEEARLAERDVSQALDALHATADAVASAVDPAAGVEMLAHHLRSRVELVDLAGEVLRAAPTTAREGDPVVWESPVADESLGTLRVRGTAALSPTASKVAAVSARMIGLQLARERAGLRAEGRLRGQLLHELLEGGPDDLAGVRDRAMLLGIDLGVPRYVTCAGWHRGDDVADGRMPTAAETAIHARFPRSISVPHPDKVVILLCPGTESLGQVRTALRRAIGSSRPGGPGLSVGVGRICLSPADYADSYAEAALALDVARRRPEPAHVVVPADLGFYGLLARGTGRRSLDVLVANVLGPLLEADAGTGSEYVKTLSAFLACDRHLERTAACLHVHPNTVRYRLAKAQEKLGVEMRDVEHRFLLELALRVQSTLDSGADPG